MIGVGGVLLAGWLGLQVVDGLVPDAPSPRPAQSYVASPSPSPSPSATPSPRPSLGVLALDATRQAPADVVRAIQRTLIEPVVAPRARMATQWTGDAERVDVVVVTGRLHGSEWQGAFQVRSGNGRLQVGALDPQAQRRSEAPDVFDSEARRMAEAVAAEQVQ